MTKQGWMVVGIACMVIALSGASRVCAGEQGRPTVEQAYPVLASGILKKAVLVEMDPGILLTSEGVEIKASRITEAVETADPRVKEELEKNRFFLLEQETVKAILVQETASAGEVQEGLSETEAIQAYLGRKFSDIQVSDEEAKTFYEANKAMMGEMSFQQVKDAVKEVLARQKRQEAVASYLQGLGGNREIRVNRDWVEAQHALETDNPVDRARRSGKPTMVEFGAEGCVPCDMMQPILDRLRKKYPEELNVVFIHVGESRVLGARFGIQSIPVQVFYDENGNEVFRHVGFYAEPEVLKQLAKLGVE
ncbi:MAG: thioredoxin family protein [Deltaproteobacteria bacterium]|nr:thioredoxin family protein [Deltaproteobacteria bacterium]